MRRLTSAIALVGVALSGALLLSGCRPRAAARDLPAVITHKAPEGHAELVRVLSRALNDASVTIADDALTRDSELIIERRLRRDAQGRPLDGRETARPERFRLVKNGPDCVLLNERTGERWRLTASTCAPL